MQMRLVIIVFSILVRLLSTKGTHAATFTFTNRCEYTVWPGILPNAGTPGLDSTGFELPKESSRTFQAPTGWSGRFWGRTGCNFDGSGSGSCLTGDCGSGQVECNGNGAEPPATLAEFTLGTGGQDFYDVSLVDGYNLPMLVEGTGGLGACASTGCTTDLNLQCPMELKVGSGEACKSACEAFGTPEYCCSGAYGSPNTCKPSIYSEMFKAACPRSYSYAYDDPTSTFTCTGADYTITFCPSSPSQKSSRDAMPATTGTASQEQGSVSQAGTVYPGYTFGSGSDAESGMRYQGSDYGGGLETDGSGPSGKALLADGSYLAGLAMGDSPRKYILRSALESILISLAGFYLCSFISLHYL